MTHSVNMGSATAADTFANANARFAAFIHTTATAHAAGDRDVYDDLVQIAMITLWRLMDRSDVLTDPAYVCTALRNAMADALRAERRARIISPWRGRRRMYTEDIR